VSLRLTLADAFAVGFALAATAAVMRRRRVLATALTAIALLGKEAMVVLLAPLAAWAVVRKDWRTAAALTVGAAPTVVWFLYLRMELPGPRLGGHEFVAPLTGAWDAIHAVRSGVPGANWTALTLSAVVLGLLAVVAFRGDRTAPWPYLGLALLLYQVCLTAEYWYLTIEATRYLLPAMSLLVISLPLAGGRSTAEVKRIA